MRDAHRTLAFVVVAANLGAGAYGLWLYRARRPASRAFWGLLLTAHGLLVAQVILGVILLQSTPPHHRLHVFYGVVLPIAAVLSYSFRVYEPRRFLLAVSLVALFIAVVGAARTIPTGFG